MAMALRSATRGYRSRYFSRFNAVVAALRSRWAWSTSTAGTLAITFGSQSERTFSRNNSTAQFQRECRWSQAGKGLPPAALVELEANLLDGVAQFRALTWRA